MSSQRPQGGGILPSTTLKSLDNLVDRLNSNANINGGNSNNSIPIIALLIGTNEGIPLSRSYGSIINPQQATLSDEVLSAVETVWATLPSATPPHVKNALHMRKSQTEKSGTSDEINSTGNKNAGTNDTHDELSHEHPHPLLSHLGLGKSVRTTMAFYDNVTLIHLQIAPFVVTLLASPGPNVNLGAVRSIAVPFLKELLDPVKNALVSIKNEVVRGHGHGVAGVNGGAPGYFHG